MRPSDISFALPSTEVLVDHNINFLHTSDFHASVIYKNSIPLSFAQAECVTTVFGFGATVLYIGAAILSHAYQKFFLFRHGVKAFRFLSASCLRTSASRLARPEEIQSAVTPVELDDLGQVIAPAPAGCRRRRKSA